MTPAPHATPLQAAIAGVVAQAHAEGARYGLSASLVFRLWARGQSLDEAMQRARAEARQHGLAVEWVIKIWEAGADVATVMDKAQAHAGRPQ